VGWEGKGRKEGSVVESKKILKIDPYNVNEFYVFRQELPAENGRNINGNIYVDL